MQSHISLGTPVVSVPQPAWLNLCYETYAVAIISLGAPVLLVNVIKHMQTQVMA